MDVSLLADQQELTRKIYINSVQTGCRLEDLPGTVDDTIYPTPSLGQDMTQGQFLSGV